MKKVIILTDGFPYIGGEKSFIRYEYEAIAKKYKVIVCAITTESQRHQGLDNSVQLEDSTIVHSIDVDIKPIDYLRAIGAIFNGVFWREELEIIRKRKAIVKATYNSLGFFVQALKYKEYIKENALVEPNEEVIVYSFWNTYYTLAFCMLAEKNSNIKIVSRYHGYDLYDYRVPVTSHQPFKKWMDRRIQGKVFVSQEGYNYYYKKYSSNANDGRVIHLGVPEVKVEPQEYNDRSILKIVSCSRMIPLKRIDMIVRALALIDEHYTIKWTHYGNGEMFASVSNLADELLSSKRNIDYELYGMVDNDELLRIYSQGDIHCFITVSSNEGLPVSIMEAFACSIPVIATNVNGIGEAVIDQYNGVLLDSNPTIEQIADAIKEVINVGYSKYAEMKYNAFKIWQKQFDAKKNAEKIVAFLDVQK